MAKQELEAAFAPQMGTEKSDLDTGTCESVFAGEYDLDSPLPQDRKPYGPSLGEPVEPKLTKGEPSDWEHQGYMVQPLRGSFSRPQSFTMMRRREFQLNDKDNFDPAQALTPRVKKSNDDGR